MNIGIHPQCSCHPVISDPLQCYRLVKGGGQTQIEGSSPDRHVIIRFETRQAALDWYASEDYQRILPIALSSSERDIVVVDGFTED